MSENKEGKHPKITWPLICRMNKLTELTGLKIYSDILFQSISIYSKNRFQLTLVIVKPLCTNPKKS